MALKGFQQNAASRFCDQRSGTGPEEGWVSLSSECHLYRNLNTNNKHSNSKHINCILIIVIITKIVVIVMAKVIID